jgi:hypothetical protein
LEANMKSKDTISIDLKINWPVLVGLVIIAGIMMIAYSAVHAQADEPANINELAAATDPSENNPEALNAVPELQCSAGFVPTVNGECIPTDDLGTVQSSDDLSSLEAVQSSSTGHFYLTNSSYSTIQTLNACASGYHMASLWEILDVSNLIYDMDHPAAHTKADSGYGPPSGWYGWVRTGGASSNSSTTGTGNCLNWSSTASDVYGVAIRLAFEWEAAPGDISTWDATSFACSFYGPVWCVKD